MTKDKIYFDDFAVGQVFEHGAVTLTEAEIIDFATRFDPQAFHIDPARAAASPYGGIIASGWHTAGVTMRMLCEGLMLRAESHGAPGVDELRWLKPVRPGDSLHIRVTITEVAPCRRKPDQRGFIHTFVETFNQDDELVQTWKSAGMIGRRPQEGRP